MTYIDEITDELSPNCKSSADDTSLFSVVHNINSSAAELNNDLAKISYWAHQWKMSFNLDPSKKGQEVIFSRKVKKDSHPPSTFNYNIVYPAASYKLLAIILDNRLSFEEHLRLVFGKTNKTIGLLRKLQCLISRFLISVSVSLFTIYIKLLSDLLLIMVTLYMNNRFIISPFTIKYNMSNITNA